MENGHSLSVRVHGLCRYRRRLHPFSGSTRRMLICTNDGAIKVKDVGMGCQKLANLEENSKNIAYWYANMPWHIPSIRQVANAVLIIVSQLQCVSHFSKHRLI